MTISRASSAAELYLPLDRQGPSPLYQQLEHAVREAVRDGRLPADAPLPSTRALASQLGVTRGVVVSAYEQLTAEGYLVTRPGGSTRVARVPSAPASRPAQLRRAFGTDFRPGRPDVTEFPRAEWLRSLRRVMAHAPAERLNYLDGGGMPELREALATYLNRVRGTFASADSIVITTGVAQGMHLVAEALRAGGARRIGLEEPFHPEYRQLLEDDGLAVTAIPVDEDGLRVDLLDAAGVDAVAVTPAHQYPTGAVLSPERRAALISWADRHDGVVIEDDYDAEFRYDRVPVGAMQGLCADRVVYAGTASKTLAPGLRLGWLAVPPRLRDPIARAKLNADKGSSAIDQLALADFIERGELDRHLRRMRVLYRHRRDALLDALNRHLPEWTPIGASAGLHVLAWLPHGCDEARVVAAAAERDIGLYGVAVSCHLPDARAGLIFGYGSIDEARIEPGIAVLAAALR
ncbi:MAG: PLP-dependent aminotransferase family protein [Candidatus Limnocylindria bacterium]